MKPTIRLAVPENRGRIEFDDVIRDKIKEEAATIGDFVLMKSSGIPLFFFAGVVDDYLQKITHVIRGEDHISNTFNQILIYEALGWEKELPQFAHLPLILNADRSKMSKRKGDVVSVAEFRKRGYLPEALLNLIALLGWHPRIKAESNSPAGKELEIYKLDTLIKLFDIKDVGRSAAVFDQQKLDFINGHYIRQFDEEKLKQLLVPDHIKEGWENNDKMISAAIRLVKDRMKNLADFTELSEYFFEKPIYDKEILIFEKSNIDNSRKGLEAVVKTLKKAAKTEWQAENLQKMLESVVKNNSLTNGDVFWPVRTALSGRQASPNPVELLIAFGKNESLERLGEALDKLK
jgi:glutamyl-tRNA synthetase